MNEIQNCGQLSIHSIVLSAINSCLEMDTFCWQLFPRSARVWMGDHFFKGDFRDQIVSPVGKKLMYFYQSTFQSFFFPEPLPESRTGSRKFCASTRMRPLCARQISAISMQAFRIKLPQHYQNNNDNQHEICIYLVCLPYLTVTV